MRFPMRILLIRTLYFVLSAGTVLALGTILILRNPGPSDREWQVLALEPNAAQPASGEAPQQRQRRWINVELDELFSTKGTDRLFAPVKVRFFDSELYVLDLGDRSGKKFDLLGNQLATYGTGTGQGPGELLNPTDIAVTPTGRIFILDPAQARISIFENDGRYSASFTVDHTALTLTTFGDTGIATVALIGEDLIRLYDTDGMPTSSFGRVHNEQEQMGVARQGVIEWQGDGRLLFAPLYAGRLYKFDVEGRNHHAVNTVITLPWPDVVYDQNGAMSIRPEHRERTATLDLTIAGDTIYALPSRTIYGEDKSVAGRIVDTYEVSTGRYVYSFVVPDSSATSLAVDGDHVAVASGEAVIAWRRRRH